MKKPSLSIRVIAITSLFLLACYTSSLPRFTTPTPQPTLASIPEVPNLSITQPSGDNLLIQTDSELENENLLVEIPEGFKIGYEAKQNNLTINEMVADHETVQDWTIMVTVQIFLGQADINPQEYQNNFTQAWFTACPDSESYQVADGVENGYDFVLWQLYCPINPSTQKVEYAYLKAIQGNDSFYLAQVAFRYEPTDNDVTQWMQYLKQVLVCDSRIPGQACP